MAIICLLAAALLMPGGAGAQGGFGGATSGGMGGGMGGATSSGMDARSDPMRLALEHGDHHHHHHHHHKPEPAVIDLLMLGLAPVVCEAWQRRRARKKCSVQTPA